MPTGPSDGPSIDTLHRIFGRHSIVFGEDAACYDALLVLVAADVKPKTMREWLVVKDIVDTQWEFARVRGLKAGVLHAALPKLIADQAALVTNRALTPEQTMLMREQLLKVLIGEEGARERFAGLLAEYQLSLDSIAAVALHSVMPLQLEIDDRANVIRNRRNAAYDELDALRERKWSRPDTSPPSAGAPAQDVPHVETPGSIVPGQPADAAGQHPNAKQTHAETTPQAGAAENNGGHVPDGRPTKS